MRRNRKPLSRAARLTKEWMGFWTADETFGNVEAIQLAPGSAFVKWILEPNQALDLFDEPTILRTRVQITPAFNAVSPTDHTTISAGIIVATDLPVSGSTFLNPLQGAYADWVWWSTWSYVANFSSADAVGQYRLTLQDQWDDVKTKRRIEAGQGLIGVVTNDPGSVSVASFVQTGRILLAH